MLELFVRENKANFILLWSAVHPMQLCSIHSFLRSQYSLLQIAMKSSVSIWYSTLGDMLLVYVCRLQPSICNHAHTHYVTEKGLGLVVIGRVNRSSQFTYLPGEEENSWPGGLWRVIVLPLLHVSAMCMESL